MRLTLARKRALAGMADSADAETISRICLCCGEAFQADGRFNRVCVPCKTKPWFNDGVQDLSVSEGRWLSAAGAE